MAVYLAFVHGSVGWVFVAILPVGWALLGLSFVAFSALYYWRYSVALRGPRAVTQLLFTANSWRVSRVAALDNELVEWCDAVILPYMLVLRFRDRGGRRFSVLIVADQVAPHTFRRMRVIARFARLPNNDSQSALR
ncbi:protein YgfX [Zhongshania sp.]|uniref:protein YgfX n=1 Tax=Zhongshania sp. TaxID=1971902 RepID=UPI003563BC5A